MPLTINEILTQQVESIIWTRNQGYTQVVVSFHNADGVERFRRELHLFGNGTATLHTDQLGGGVELTASPAPGAAKGDAAAIDDFVTQVVEKDLGAVLDPVQAIQFQVAERIRAAAEIAAPTAVVLPSPEPTALDTPATEMPGISSKV